MRKTIRNIYAKRHSIISTGYIGWSRLIFGSCEKSIILHRKKFCLVSELWQQQCHVIHNNVSHAPRLIVESVRMNVFQRKSGRTSNAAL